MEKIMGSEKNREAVMQMFQNLNSELFSHLARTLNKGNPMYVAVRTYKDDSMTKVVNEYISERNLVDHNALLSPLTSKALKATTNGGYNDVPEREMLVGHRVQVPYIYSALLLDRIPEPNESIYDVPSFAKAKFYRTKLSELENFYLGKNWEIVKKRNKGKRYMIFFKKHPMPEKSSASTQDPDKRIRVYVDVKEDEDPLKKIIDKYGSEIGIGKYNLETLADSLVDTISLEDLSPEEKDKVLKRTLVGINEDVIYKRN